MVWKASKRVHLHRHDSSEIPTKRFRSGRSLLSEKTTVVADGDDFFYDFANEVVLHEWIEDPRKEIIQHRMIRNQNLGRLIVVSKPFYQRIVTFELPNNGIENNRHSKNQVTLQYLLKVLKIKLGPTAIIAAVEKNLNNVIYLIETKKGLLFRTEHYDDDQNEYDDEDEGVEEDMGLVGADGEHLLVDGQAKVVDESDKNSLFKAKDNKNTKIAAGNAENEVDFDEDNKEFFNNDNYSKSYINYHEKDIEEHRYDSNVEVNSKDKTYQMSFFRDKKDRVVNGNLKNTINLDKNAYKSLDNDDNWKLREKDHKNKVKLESEGDDLVRYPRRRVQNQCRTIFTDTNVKIERVNSDSDTDMDNEDPTSSINKGPRKLYERYSKNKDEVRINRSDISAEMRKRKQNERDSLYEDHMSKKGRIVNGNGFKLSDNDNDDNDCKSNSKKKDDLSSNNRKRDLRARDSKINYNLDKYDDDNNKSNNNSPDSNRDNNRSFGLNTKDNSNNSKKIAEYYSDTTKVTYPLHVSDYACLENGEWLNDNVIDWYLAYLFDTEMLEEDHQRTHIFSTLLFAIMRRCTHDKSADRFNDMRRTIRADVDIFSKDFLIIPVNESNNHWYLIIVCFIGLAGYQNSPPSTDNLISLNHNDSNDVIKNPCILIFDSLKSSATTVSSMSAQKCTDIRDLREYFEYEYRIKKHQCRSFSEQELPCCIPSIPKQDNSFDCGVYVMKNVEFFFKDPIRNFNFPLKSLGHWFTPTDVLRKRIEISKIVKRLSDSQASESRSKITLPTLHFPSY